VNSMSNVKQLSNVKNPTIIALIGAIQDCVEKFDDATEVEIVASLEMVKTQYALAPFIEALRK